MNTSNEPPRQALQEVVGRIIEGSQSNWALIRRSDVAVLRRLAEEASRDRLNG